MFIDHCRNRFDADKALREKGLNPVEDKYLLEEPALEEAIQSQPIVEEKKVD